MSILHLGKLSQAICFQWNPIHKLLDSAPGCVQLNSMGTLQGQFGRKREQAHNYGNKEQKIQSTYQFMFPLSLSSGAWGCVKTSLGTFTSLLQLACKALF